MKKEPAASEDTLLNLLVAWLNRSSEANKNKTDSSAEKLQKNLDENMPLSKTVLVLTETLNKCVQEVSKITNTLTTTVNAVNQHAAMIEEIYAVQNAILQLLKSNVVTASASKEKDINKKKTEKPN